MMEPELVTFLTTEMADTVGARVHPAFLPQNETVPALVYQNISSTHDKTTDDRRTVSTRMQISAFADSYADAKATGDAVRIALDGFSGPLVEGGTRVISCLLDSDTGPMYDYEALKFRADLDFIILYPEQ